MFKNKNVLVAGGNGLIGKQLVPLLTDRGANVKVVDKNIDPDMDLTDFYKCLDVCHDMDYVFNLLCIKGSPKAMKERPASHLVPMLRFNTNLMEAARICSVSKFYIRVLLLYTNQKRCLVKMMYG